MVEQPRATPEPDPVPRPSARTLPAKDPKDAKASTRAAVVWAFTIVGIAVLILLVIFMMQNQAQTTIYFLGFQGQMALGISMLLAAVGGAVVVAIVAAVRIIQLRSRAGAASRRLERHAK